MLIAAGAYIDVNTNKQPSGTPLIIAARHGHTEIAKVLIAAGASLEIRNSLGGTALG
jgi:ankyrin repeat protein